MKICESKFDMPCCPGDGRITSDIHTLNIYSSHVTGSRKIPAGMIHRPGPKRKGSDTVLLLLLRGSAPRYRPPRDDRRVHSRKPYRSTPWDIRVHLSKALSFCRHRNIILFSESRNASRFLGCTFHWYSFPPDHQLFQGGPAAQFFA